MSIQRKLTHFDYDKEMKIDTIQEVSRAQTPNKLPDKMKPVPKHSCWFLTFLHIFFPSNNLTQFERCVQYKWCIIQICIS